MTRSSNANQASILSLSSSPSSPTSALTNTIIQSLKTANHGLRQLPLLLDPSTHHFPPANPWQAKKRKVARITRRRPYSYLSTLGFFRRLYLFFFLSTPLLDFSFLSALSFFGFFSCTVSNTWIRFPIQNVNCPLWLQKLLIQTHRHAHSHASARTRSMRAWMDARTCSCMSTCMSSTHAPSFRQVASTPHIWP